MKEKLDSERLNYLIWRYLIEGNYRETALKFQKEWHIEAPHRQLEFARYVKSHALVNVINKGLKYDSLERDFAQSQVAQNAAAEAEAMQLGVFGPVGHDVPPQHDAEEHEQSQDEDAPGDEDEEPLPPVVDAENARKRPSDRPQQPQLNGGSPAKRPRLSNGYENGAHAATADPMDLDGQNHHHGTENNHAYPSPLEGEQAPTPTLRTDGPDQATQIEKVEELASKTVFIPLGSGDASVLSPPTTSPKAASENASVLLHCQWNPRDPSILAGAGSEALARVWTVSRATAALAGQDPASHGHVPDGDVSPPFHSLVEGDVSPGATVTAMAWNGDGTVLAIATGDRKGGRISLWNTDGTHITHFEVPEAPVYKLRWSPNNAAILGINPDKDDMLVTVYSAATSNTVSFPVPVSGFAQEDKVLDVAWTSDNEFLLAGGELLSLMQCSETNITVVKKFETRGGDSISHVQYNEKAQLAATCDRKGFVDIWDSSGKVREIQAHDGQVTTLAWQPGTGRMADDAALLASGGADGAIFIWNARSMDGIPRCSMTMDSPIVALAFTPDGAFIAGATCEKILIWKVGEHNIPRASWSRRPHPGWLSPQANAEKEQYEHCLCWDATGQKLAYGANSRLAVINFR